jgi:Flp pilus assembly protein TadG
MTRRARRGSANSDRGAAAVEFALLLPLLVLLIFGMIDFGRAINAQITITQAAREGARVLALPGGTTVGSDGNQAYQDRAIAAGNGLGLTASNVMDLPDSSATPETGCPTGSGSTGDDAVVKVTYKFTFITPVGSIFGSTKTLTAEGVMPCEN